MLGGVFEIFFKIRWLRDGGKERQGAENEQRGEAHRESQGLAHAGSIV